MKKKIFKSLLAMACLLSSTSVSAYDFEVDGIFYNVVSLNEQTCEVTTNGDNYSGDLIIPATVKYANRELTVVRIAKSAFEKCSKLTSITIPNSIVSIGDDAFGYCSGLTSVTTGNSVTTIDSWAFHNCSGLTTLYSFNTTPPSVGSNNFTNNQYMTLDVFVPQEALATYQSADPWNNFWNLQGFDATGVENVKSEGGNDNIYYDLWGNRLNAPKRGLNIINHKKVMMKQ